MKKILLFFPLFMLTIGCSVNNLKAKIDEKVDNHNINSIPIMSFDKYKDFVIDDALSLHILRYTVQGIDSEEVNDLDRIKREYNAISKYKVLGEIERSCEDNTTIYEFNLKNGNKVSFEFECDWLVIDNKHYEIERGN